MSTKPLAAAITAYRQALLDQAAGDLLARKAGLPQTGPVALLEARAEVLRAAANHSCEELAASLMAARFLSPPAR